SLKTITVRIVTGIKPTTIRVKINFVESFIVTVILGVWPLCLNDKKKNVKKNLYRHRYTFFKLLGIETITKVVYF
ncbi:MAG: hypothetical protein NZL93_04555, partial [Chthoniobacterales bacterium]|nr:hypothetical protein [Chthoniobacterales bacterium]